MVFVRIAGFLLFVTGIVIGLYVGIWVCFIGGIVDLIAAVKADVTVPLDVAIGIAKIVFSGFAGWLCAAICVLPGAEMMGVNKWR